LIGEPAVNTVIRKLLQSPDGATGMLIYCDNMPSI